MKDIFIDNNIAKNFATPLSTEYKDLIQWIAAYDELHGAQNAVLALSNKLLGEYHRTCQGSNSLTNILALIDKLQRQGRINKITNAQIKGFRQGHSREFRKLTCNHEDRDHIPVVLLSDRKYGLCRDKKLCRDLRDFPGFNAVVSGRPRDIPYEG